MHEADKSVGEHLIQLQLNKTSKPPLHKVVEGLPCVEIELHHARAELSAHEAEARRMSTIQNSLEALKAHLQLQLRHKSAECER